MKFQVKIKILELVHLLINQIHKKIIQMLIFHQLIKLIMKCLMIKTQQTQLIILQSILKYLKIQQMKTIMAIKQHLLNLEMKLQMKLLLILLNLNQMRIKLIIQMKLLMILYYQKKLIIKLGEYFKTCLLQIIILYNLQRSVVIP